VRWLVLWGAVWLAGCALVTPTPTPVPTSTAVPISPPPTLTATILPDAAPSFHQVAGRVPFTVTFTAHVSGGTPPYTYAWDFDGDGKTDSAEKSPPPFVYTKPLAYNAALMVTDATGQDVRVERRIVAFASPKLPAWKYGVTAHLERRRVPYYPTLGDVTRAAQWMQDAGVQVVRMDFNWDMLNPTRDEWRFDDYDAVVRIVRQHKMDMLGIVDYTSWWASSAQDSNDWRVRLYAEPLRDADFARYTYEVVKHFKNDVHVWQIWNEPNTQDFWKPKPNPARYASLLQEAYRAAKYADPNAVVVFAGLSGNGVEGDDDAGLRSNFVAQAYQAGARGYFDAMAIHPYMLPNGGIDTLREKIAATRAVLNAHGDQNIPLWLTEIGVPTDVPWWQTAPLQSEQDAANWLNLVYTKLWDLTPTIFWYELQDRAGDSPESHFGLLRADDSPKAAYERYRALAGRE
jgi:GH35 family endo-1,4-beta-xylanase